MNLTESLPTYFRRGLLFCKMAPLPFILPHSEIICFNTFQYNSILTDLPPQIRQAPFVE